MTLLLDEMVALLAAAALWLGAVVGLSAVVGIAAAVAAPTRRIHVVRAAVVAGLVAAGLSARLGLPDPGGFAVMGRPVPLIWVVVGAGIGAGLALLRVSGEGSAAIPAPGAGRL